jgi:hypothetical protein
VTQISEIKGGGSYMSQNDLRLHFGLGTQTVMNAVEISWPSGIKEVYRDLPVDLIYTIVEGSGVTDKTPFAGQAAAETSPSVAKKSLPSQ